MNDQQTLFDLFFRTRKGKIVIGQRPNPPLIAWFVASAAARTLPCETGRKGASVVATGSLVYWSLLELFDGVNLFRRTLGALTLLGMAASAVRKERKK